LIQRETGNMRHLTTEQIAAYQAGGMRASEKFFAFIHLLVCGECRAALKKEKRLFKSTNTKLKRITSHSFPTNLMDARVGAVISQIAANTAPQVRFFGKWATVAALVVVMLASSYSVFFFAPIVGAARETPAQAFVSSKIIPIYNEIGNVVPDMSDIAKKEVFFRAMCDTLMICTSERIKWMYSEGYTLEEVYFASVVARVIGASTESVLPLLKQDKTWGQIFSELNIPFSQQLEIEEGVKQTIKQTETAMDNQKTFSVPVRKNTDGSISSVVDIPEDVAKKIPEGKEATVEIDRTGKPTGNVEVLERPTYYTGNIVSVESGYEIFTVDTENGDTVTVRVTPETNMRRYGDYFFRTELRQNQLCVVNGVWSEGVLFADFVDIKEPIRSTNFEGVVIDMDGSSITVTGFGAPLKKNENSNITGTLEIGSKVEFTAFGNDYDGFQIEWMKASPKIQPTPTPAQPRATVEGIVVGIDEIEKLILLDDGTSIFYNKLTEFAGGMPWVGSVIASEAYEVNTNLDNKFQDQAIKITISAPKTTDTFEYAKKLDSIVCLSGCNWIRPEGVTRITLEGVDTSFLIIPDTVGHDQVTPNRKGYLLILSGNTVDGVNMITKVSVVDPKSIVVKSGVIVSHEGMKVKLDDGTEITLRSFTAGATGVAKDAKAEFRCWQTEGKLTALEVTLVEETKKTIETPWTSVVSFDGTKLVLEEGLVVEFDENTVVVTAVLKEEIDSSQITMGSRVICVYTDNGDGRKIAVKVMVYIQAP